MTEAGPFPSRMRKGLTAHSRLVARRQGDKVVGTVEVRYENTETDSVVHLVLEGTRKE